MSTQSILSVGIDLGTSTTQVIFSKLKMENTSSFFTVPRISIVDKEVVYTGKVHSTPLIGRSLIDADKIRALVEEEYKNANVSPSELTTGAVIITGESARKENSKAVLLKLSDLAGEFVVSTAGPDLEAIIAGKGSGAWKYSLDNECLAANIDIGGGTANIVLFENGETISKGCVDIGGKQITYDNSMKVTYISPSAKLIAERCGINIVEGKSTSINDLKIICRKMDLLLLKLLSGEADRLLDSIKTHGSSNYNPIKSKTKVFFSGGVATAIYENNDDETKYGDIGIILGKEISQGEISRLYDINKSSETIRATVVGAGNYTTTISGSTIFYSDNIFPLKNVPVLKLTKAEEDQCFSLDENLLAEKILWFSSQSSEQQILLAIEGKKNPSYKELGQIAKIIADAANKALGQNTPLLISVKNDIAKALGQTIYTMLNKSRSVIVIDSVLVEQNEYIDLGKPLMNGLVIPVVVKTLILK